MKVLIPVTPTQRAAVHKICFKSLEGHFSGWFKPAQRDLDLSANCLIHDIVKYDGMDALNTFIKSGTVGDWSDAYDEIVNDIFLG